MTTMATKTKMWTIATVLSALIPAGVATPALARDEMHGHAMRRHAVHTHAMPMHRPMHRHMHSRDVANLDRPVVRAPGRRIYIRTARSTQMNPLDFFIFNGNQPYFDGYNGQPGYMGYYGNPGRLSDPVYYIP